MAREYAPIRLAIWADDDFRALPPQAQHLYFVLLTSPSLSYCGVADWRPARIAALAQGWTVDDVVWAAGWLVRGLYIVVDADSEEVLVRSYIKHDGLMKNPKTAVSMAMAFAGTSSATLRGVIVHELLKLRTKQPDVNGWGSPRVRELLDRKAIDPAHLPLTYGESLGVGQPEELPEDLPPDLPQGLPPDYVEPHPVNLGVGLPERSLPAPAPAPSSSSMGGYVTGVRHQSDAEDSEQNNPPPDHCPNHPSGTTAPCRPCGAARQARELWDAQQRRTVADARRAAIAACELCDEQQWRIPPAAELYTDLPKFAESARIDRGRCTFTIDGRPFPWYIADDGPQVTGSPNGLSMITVRIYAKRVEIIEKPLTETPVEQPSE